MTMRLRAPLALFLVFFLQTELAEAQTSLNAADFQPEGVLYDPLTSQPLQGCENEVIAISAVPDVYYQICVKCKPDYNLVLGRCVLIDYSAQMCGPRYALFDNRCVSCDAVCQWDSATGVCRMSCLTCPEGSRIEPRCTLRDPGPVICPSDQTFNPSTNRCEPPKATGTPPTSTMALCPLDAFWNGTRCELSCDPASVYDPGSRGCRPAFCDSSCGTCAWDYKATQCIQCKSGYELREGKCFTCTPELPWDPKTQQCKPATPPPPMTGPVPKKR